MDVTFMSIGEQFFSCIPVKLITWHMEWNDWSLEKQECLLKQTVHHPHCERFPPAQTYQQSFLKYIITQLERCFAEICDGLYEAYTNLISQHLEQQSGYKTYFLKSEEKEHGTVTCRWISLCESTNLISGGTTGLVTWQAAQNLAEWAIENKTLFQNKKVLELGSGLGFTGLVISTECAPIRYTFSDFHHLVLQQLKHNVLINAYHNTTMSTLCLETTKELNSEKLKGTVTGQCKSMGNEEWIEESYGHDGELNKFNLPGNVCVDILRLDWEEVEQRQLEFIGQETDIVMAADVVYDASIIPALVRVLSGLLHSTNPPAIYIASTVRNQDTDDHFLQALNKSGLNGIHVKPPSKEIFEYDRSTPVCIRQISQNLK